MRISIFGLGYVGVVSLGCLARDGHTVVGVDVDPIKLDLIRAERSPIVEEGMEELIRSAVQTGRVAVTNDATTAVRETELSFLCVGTPSCPNGSQDLSALERLSLQLGAALRAKGGYHVFVVRSTVLPGTVEEVVIPLIEQASGARCGQGFGICFQPEFLREGSSIRDYDHPPYVVVGGESERAIAPVREVFGHLPCDFKVCSIRSAEMLKYACNSFHALKITFANEIGRCCQGVGVDPHEVMDLVCQDMQLNISPAYLRPGFAFGGSCLPKDLRALNHLASRRDVSLPMLSAIAPSNQIHLDHAVDLALSTGRRSVGMFGLSFKTGTDDLRESPLVAMAERFLGKGLRLQVYDPGVNLSRLLGANRRYIEETIPHIGSLLCDDPEMVMDRSEVLVVALRGEALLKALQQRCRPDHVILDVVNLPNKDKLKGTYMGVCW